MGLAKDYIIYRHVVGDPLAHDYYVGKLGDGSLKPLVRGCGSSRPADVVYLHRLDALALVQRLNAEEHDSFGPYLYDKV